MQWDGRGGSRSPGEEGNLSKASAAACLGGELKQEGEGREELSDLGCSPIPALL